MKDIFKDMSLNQKASGFLNTLISISLLILLKIIGKIFFRLKARGIENIPLPPYIIAPNHASYLDGFVIAASVPIKSFMNLYFLALQEFFNNWFTAYFAKVAHVIPMEPKTHLRKAIQISGYILKQGNAICIFPEGGITDNGSILPFKKGIGMLSKEVDVPILPCLIQGTFEALPRGAAFPRFKKIIVAFGKPLYQSEIDFAKKPENMDDYEWIAFNARRKVLEMKS
ncbi:MAG: 1-acyl-sn-glycerol-3-phosphate acyltransferase [Deltaproteobacteria bacterium]|nr:1-acyl-sn-glycerol-3-phosphate acyltransferase [Deltaproteobacteria bacterium]